MKSESTPAPFASEAEPAGNQVSYCEAPWGIFFTDEHGRFVDANPAFVRICGVPLPTLTQMSFTDLFSSDWRGPVQSQLEKAFEAGHISLEVPHTQPGTWSGWWQVEVNRVAPNRIAGFVQPFTDRSLGKPVQVEQELRLMQFCIDRAADAIYWVKPNAEILNVNESACRMLGYSKDWLVGKFLTDIHPNFSPERWPQRWEDLQRRKSLTFETNLRRSDGQIIDVEVNSNFIQFEGEDLGCAIVRDLTSRKQVDEKLRMLQFAVDHAADAAFWLESHGRIRYANRAATRRFGLSVDELLKRSIFDLTPDATPAAWDKYWNELKQIGTKIFEARHRAADGGVIPVEVTANYVNLGRSELVFESSRDITERKRAGESLRASEERYSLVERAVNDGIWDWNVGSEGMFCSPRWSELLGYTEEELARFKTRDFWDLIHPDDRHAFKDLAWRSFQNGERYHVEIRVRHKDGTYRWLLTRGEAVRDASGTPVRAVGSITDISDHKRAEEQMVQLRDSLAHVTRLGVMGELAAGLAHEMNQPLAALRLYATTAEHLGSQFDSPELIDCLKRIDEQSHRAAEIVRRMRSFVSHRMTQRELVEPNHLVLEVLSLLSNDLRHSQVKVDMDLESDLPRVYADPIQIEQVLVNLIRNAMDAMSVRGWSDWRLSVSTAQIDSFVRFSIADNGAGLDHELESKLFQPFQSSKPKGLGLGLAICRTVVESHGGEIGAHGNAEGGMTFRFSLPISDRG